MAVDWAAVAAEAEENRKKQVASNQPTPLDNIANGKPPESPVEEGRNIVQDVIVNGIAGGAEQAVRGTYSTVKGVADAAGMKLPEMGEPLIAKPEGLAASITRDVTQFGLGFVGGMGVLRGVGAAAKLAPVAKEIIASGIGTGVVADPTAPRLANLIQKYPWLENPVTEYLSQDDKDGVLESKFKATLEDMMTSGAASILFKTVKGLKHATKGDEATTSKAAAEVAQEVSPSPIASTNGNGATKPVYEMSSQELTKADQISKAAEINVATTAGKTAFKLSGDEAKALDAQIHYAVSNDKLEEIFTGGQFTVFNDKRAAALPETKDLVEAAGLYVAPKLDSAIGKQRSHESVKKLADLIGEDHKTLYANLATTFQHVQNLDATITAAKALAFSQAREVKRLATKIRFEANTPEDRELLLQSQQRLTDIIGMTRGIQKEAARGTSAGRITTGEKDLVNGLAGEKDLDEIIELASMAKSEKDILSIFKAKSILGKLIDVHNEVWINGILSGVKTHVVNLASASTNTLLTPFNQMVGGAITRNPAEIREGLALYRGLMRHAWDSLEMAARAFKSEAQILDPHRGTDESIRKVITSDNLPALGRAADWLGTAARMPGRFLKAEDEFFKQMNYRAHVEARASREAADLVASGKLSPDKMVEYTDGTTTVQISEVEKYIRDKFETAFKADNSGAHEDAIEYAQEITFTQDLGGIKTHTDWGNVGESVQKFASSHPWLRGTFLPFIKVPTNIMRAAGDLTPPIAALKKEGLDILTGANVDPHDKAMFMGRLATGTMLWTAAAGLAMNGRITGSAFGDKQMRDRQMESGWQPYSFVFDKEDGTKGYVQFQRLDPFGSFFGIAADIAYISQHVSEQQGHDVALAASLALSKNIASKSYLQGLVEISSMIGGGYTSEEMASRMLNMRAGSYVPNYMNLYTGDDELKHVRSMLDAVMAKIPGISSTVEAKRDYFGEKRVAPMGYPWNAIDPFPVSQDKDAVRTELARLSRSGSEVRFELPNTKLGSLDLVEMKNAQGRTAYDVLTEKIGTVEIGGMNFHSRLKEVIQSDRYKSGTDGTSTYHTGDRVVMLKNWQAKYREKAIRETLKEFNLGESGQPLQAAVRQDKRNERAVRHGRVEDVRNLLQFAE